MQTNSISRPLAEMHCERHCSTGLWYITVSQDIGQPVTHWQQGYAWYSTCMWLKCDVTDSKQSSEEKEPCRKRCIVMQHRSPVPTRPRTLPTRPRRAVQWGFLVVCIRACWVMHMPISIQLYHVIPLYVIPQWSNGTQIVFPPMAHWWSLLDRWLKSAKEHIDNEMKKWSAKRRLIELLY